MIARLVQEFIAAAGWLALLYLVCAQVVECDELKQRVRRTLQRARHAWADS